MEGTTYAPDMSDEVSGAPEGALVTLYDLQLLSQAAYYDLESRADRKRSAADLERFFFRLVRHAVPEVFVEAGAKDARSSRRARTLLPDARIVAFEANPHTFERFRQRNAAAEHRLEYLNLALDREPGTVTFNVRVTDDGRPSADGQASLGKRYDHERYQEVNVASTSLDAFFAEHRFASCALWVDVEGASEQVLDGAQRLLQRTSVAIIEVEDRPLWENQTLLAKAVMRRFFAAGLVPVARDFQSRYQYNVVFVRDALLSNDRLRLELARRSSAMAGAAPWRMPPELELYMARLKKLANDPVGFVRDSRMFRRYFGNATT